MKLSFSSIVKNGRLVLGAWLFCCAQMSAYAQSSPRIVSLGGAITETVYALGAENYLVGVDSTSLYPKQAQSLPNVGYVRSLSSEGILALRPSLILATEEAGPPVVINQLKRSSLKQGFEVIPAKRQFSGITQRIQRIGVLTGRQVQAKKLIADLTKEWSSTQQLVQKQAFKRKPKVLFILSHSSSQIMVGGKNSQAAAMIAYAGGVNAADHFSGFKTLNAEALIAMNPDIILVTQQGLDVLGGKSELLKLPGVRSTTAGKKGRVVALEAMYMLGFGPRFPYAVRDLHNQFYKVFNTQL